jgi:hypothetical protein
MIEPWAMRPDEVAHLLNPAFTGVLLRRSVDAYVRESSSGMPFSLVFLVLPFALHRGTFDRLPAKATHRLPQWIQDNRDILVTFPRRMRTLVPYTREGLIFAAQRRILAFGTDGSVNPGPKKLRGLSTFLKSGFDIPAILMRAQFMGRWLALSGSPSTLFSVLGVTP